ncbi:HDOD domain-containing protein [Burkholderiaceae bacterium DAT-1]|nr:HDOD domain-containing protein [Burkholderiaceae bacterium DAT-1]
MEIGDIFDRAAGRMPMVPKVVQELIVGFDNDSLDVDEVIDKVSHDQVLSAKVLRLANSARISGGRPVKSIDDAVVLLGFDSLRLLVVSSGLSSMSAPNPGFDRQAFWRHCFQSANTTKALAGLAKLDHNTAYTCGLLKDIGELLIHVAFPNESIRIDRLVENGADRIQLETMVIGIDLTMVGEELARRWHFPKEIQAAIRHQKNPMGCDPFEPFSGLVWLAELLVNGFSKELSRDDIASVLPAPLLEKLGIEPTKLIAMLEDMRTECMAVDDLL